VPVLYQVLLVDDERIVLESLKGSLNWEQIGFSVCGTADNGMEALERIREYRPDVVFTDIRMPGISGLELIKRVREISQCSIVIASGFAEFGYAQKAIKFGIDGYCLKPFDEEEIVSLLTRIRGRLDKEMEAADLELEGSLTDKPTEDELFMLNSMLRHRGFRPGRGYAVFVARGVRGHEWSRMVAGMKVCAPVATGRSKRAILVEASSFESLKSWIETMIRDHPECSAGWCCCDRPEQLYLAFEQADIAAYQYFLDPSRRLHCFRQAKINEITLLFKELKESILQRNVAAANAMMDLIVKLMREQEGNIQTVLRLNHLVVTSVEWEPFTYEPYHYGYEELAKAYADLAPLIENLKAGIAKFANDENNESGPVIDHDNLKKIIEDVDLHYDRPGLSIRELSGRYFVHPNYLSQLFKKHTGDTFTDYVTKKRIQRACHLLSRTDMSIRAVGENCGYPDYFHFAKMFKKVVGLTPSAYRDSGICPEFYR